jgi:hypothetical protein
VCPFRGDAYQLMRNLAFAHEWPGRDSSAWFGFLVCLVDASKHASNLRDEVEAFKAMLKPGVRGRVGMISYENIADILVVQNEPVLAAWVRDRVNDVLVPR